MDQFSFAFPIESVVCATGDYLICHHSGEAWQVYLVEDLLIVKRLVPLLNDPATLMLEEQLLDSMPPAYFNEVQLLVTAFDSNFTDKSEALQAIQLQTLTERAQGLLRAARQFTELDCWVVRPTNIT
jgi:hypothetical protein